MPHPAKVILPDADCRQKAIPRWSASWTAICQTSHKRHISISRSILCTATNITFLSKVNWFAEEFKLICQGKQIDLLSKGISVPHQEHIHSMLKSYTYKRKFNEFGQQIHWVYSANSLKLQSKFIEFTNGNNVSSWQTVVYTQSQRPSISFTKRLPTLPNHSCHTLTCCCPWRVEARCNPVIRQR